MAPKPWELHLQSKFSISVIVKSLFSTFSTMTAGYYQTKTSFYFILLYYKSLFSTAKHNNSNISPKKPSFYNILVCYVFQLCFNLL